MFPEVYISEFYDNNFKIKLKKNETENITIVTLFGILEDNVKLFFIKEN